MSDFYETDLAWCHFTGFSDPALPPAVIGALQRAGITDGTVVDLGCNGGLLLRALCEAGYRAVGVDISSAAIEIARRTAPEARLAVAAAGCFDFPPCAAVTALGEVLCYAPEGGRDTLSDDTTLRRIHDALRPGGLLLFDILVRDDAAPMAYRTFRQGEDWAALSEAREDLPGHRLRREITVFRKVDGAWRRSAETHVLAVHARDEIETRLAGAGFAVSTADAIGPVALLPRRTAFICRKPAC